MVVTHGSHPGTASPSAWTVGNFDGIHRGHRAMLERVGAKARERGMPACVLTFEPHPRELFNPQDAPARITRMRDKLELLADAGMDRVHVARFDRRLASMTAERFVEDLLVAGLGVRWLLVGGDFRFGAKRAGGLALLRSEGARLGFEVEAMPEVREADERVSSSAVRAALAAGDLAAAERLLGRPYTLAGRIAHGAKLGRTLGFPTANIMLRRAPPVAGVFAVSAEDEANGERWIGAASVGLRPTVNAVKVPLLEAHLVGMQGEHYGRHLRVRFHRKLRDEAKYDDLATLTAAIAKDVEDARHWFEKNG